MNKKVIWLVIILLMIGCSLQHHLFKTELIIQNQGESYTEFLTRFTHVKAILWGNEYEVIDIFFCKAEESGHLIGIIIYKNRGK